MGRAISERPGNPASGIREAYQELMGLGDLDELKRRALAIVANGGIGAKNRAVFTRTVKGAPNVARLQGYLTNFVLAADGLAVMGRRAG